MSVTDKKRENRRNRKPSKRTYNRRNAGERGVFEKTIYSIITLVITGVIILGIINLFNTNEMKGRVDDIKKLQYPKGYSEYVEKYSEEYNVDENLVYAVIHTESHFKNDDQSGAGAMGLMQITPECFDFLKQNIPDDKTDYDINSLYDPEINIKFGAYFLSYLLDKYDNIEKTALAGYNAGFGIVDQWLEDKNCSSDGENLDVIPYSETADYVVKVHKAKKMYEELY